MIVSLFLKHLTPHLAHGADQRFFLSFLFRCYTPLRKWQNVQLSLWHHIFVNSATFHALRTLQSSLKRAWLEIGPHGKSPLAQLAATAWPRAIDICRSDQVGWGWGVRIDDRGGVMGSKIYSKSYNTKIFCKKHGSKTAKNTSKLPRNPLNTKYYRGRG